MQLQDKTIIILGYMRFDGLASTNFTIARYLSQWNDVYYIDHPYTWKDYLTADKSAKEFKIRSSLFNKRSDGILSTDCERLKVVITPPVLPINWLPEGGLYRWFLRLNETIILKRIRKLIKKMGIEHYIYINSFNFHFPGILRALNPVLSVYHCVDPLIIEYDKKHGIISEKIILQESDVVICTSKALYDEKQLINPNTYFVANGATIADPVMVLKKSYKPHTCLSAITHPIAGYLGAIERRMDFELMSQVIAQCPTVNFVFIGPISEEHVPQKFRNCQNVFLLPPIRHDEINQVLAAFDVCLIPFKADSVSRTIFPLKLFEYLGMGKPVVATTFNTDLQSFTGDCVTYAANAGEFVHALQEHLISTQQQIAQRLMIAAANTWQERTKQFAAILASHL
ncbi:hypothetical protein GCM10023231_03240 [Olivibacter ginsenosidimutans]|uniref:Glycosyltransferase family 1 protein n=1 Tax=Olivibacter ginsenosidimutans TaxID=1176537 RepID=A0ABP9AGI5_9SPHI